MSTIMTITAITNITRITRLTNITNIKFTTTSQTLNYRTHSIGVDENSGWKSVCRRVAPSRCCTLWRQCQRSSTRYHRPNVQRQSHCQQHLQKQSRHLQCPYVCQRPCNAKPTIAPCHNHKNCCVSCCDCCDSLLDIIVDTALYQSKVCAQNWWRCLLRDNPVERPCTKYTDGVA